VIEPGETRSRVVHALGLDRETVPDLDRAVTLAAAQDIERDSAAALQAPWRAEEARRSYRPTTTPEGAQP
jgi:glycosyltransferase A (GT-A) superfamily protein (DUF2064 family)